MKDNLPASNSALLKEILEYDYQHLCKCGVSALTAELSDKIKTSLNGSSIEGVSETKNVMTNHKSELEANKDALAYAVKRMQEMEAQIKELEKELAQFKSPSVASELETALAESYSKLQVLYGEKCAELNKPLDQQKLEQWHDAKGPIDKPDQNPSEIEQIAKILRDNITFSGQVGDYVIHGAIQKIIEWADKRAAREEATLSEKFGNEQIQDVLYSTGKFTPEICEEITDQIQKELKAGGYYITRKSQPL